MHSDITSQKIIIGIDPGFADMGYGVIAFKNGQIAPLAWGSIKTLPSLVFEKRLAFLYSELQKLLDKYKPSIVGIEKLFFSKNTKTAMDVAEARGVIRVCLEHANIPAREFFPAEIKIAVCGSGNASKNAVQKMTKTLLRLNEIPKPDDAADALAIAITGAYSKINV